jgi:hypothetical protein
VQTPAPSAHTDKEGRDKLRSAALATLVSIAPKDEIEGMLAAQMSVCDRPAKRAAEELNYSSSRTAGAP